MRVMGDTTHELKEQFYGLAWARSELWLQASMTSSSCNAKPFLFGVAAGSFLSTDRADDYYSLWLYHVLTRVLLAHISSGEVHILFGTV